MNRAIVLNKTKLSPSLFLLTLRPKPGFAFKAGQFVIVPLPPDPQAPSDAKPPKGFYSIASSEHDPGELELLIEQREHYVSNWMCTRRGGDRVSLEGPLGKFGLSGKPRPQAFLGFKAGMAPLRSMILSQLESGSTQMVELYLGQPDLLFDAQWKQLAAQYRHFSYHPAADPAAALIEARSGHKDADIYLAGFNREVEPMLAALEGAGFDKASVKCEKFG